MIIFDNVYMELVYNDEPMKVSPILLDYTAEYLKENKATKDNIQVLKNELIIEWSILCTLKCIEDDFSNNKFEYYLKTGFEIAFGNNIN